MDSGLNLNASAFEPGENADLRSIIQDGYKSMYMAVCASNTFPIGTSYTLFQTFGSFNMVNNHLVGTALVEANRITQRESPLLRLNINEDIETNMDQITNANDFVMDRLNFTMDIESGHEKLSNTTWSDKPILLSTKLKGVSPEVAAIDARPQIWFTGKADNSNSIFVPLIQYKPNSLTPLTIKEIHDIDGNLVGYEHPYHKELTAYIPPPWAMKDEWQPSFPLPIEGSVFRLVNSMSTLEDLLAHLDTVQEIAIDLEHNSYRSYLGITCLIQITTHTGGDFIIDPLGLREELHLLNKTFTDPNKLKVFHGADNDIQWLQRDFGVYVVGMFDTHQAAIQLGLQGRSLMNLLKQYCHFQLDKTHQLTDWRTRPLPLELLNYARNDTHYLLYLWRRMREDLRAFSPIALQTVFDMSQQVCLKTYVKPVQGPDSHMAAYYRSRKQFNNAQMTALRTAWAWRDKCAREMDESPAFLMPNHMLLAVAEALPRDMQGLRAICVPMPPSLKDMLHDLHTIILTSRVIPEEPLMCHMPAGVMGMLTPPPDLNTAQHDQGGQVDMSATSRGSGPYPQFLAGSSIFGSPPPSPIAHASTTQDLLFNSLAELEKTKLNADVQSFVPPFDRYRAYRVISQVEKMKILKEKEAKIQAISRRNEFIRNEVLQGHGGVPPVQPSTSRPWAGQPSTSEAWPTLPSTPHSWPAIPSTSHAYVHAWLPCYQHFTQYPPPGQPMFMVPTTPDARQQSVFVPSERKRKIKEKEIQRPNQAETSANARASTSFGTTFNAGASTSFGTSFNAGANTSASANAGANTSANFNAGANTSASANAGANTSASANAGANTSASANAGANTSASANVGANTSASANVGSRSQFYKTGQYNKYYTYKGLKHPRTKKQ